MSSINYLKFREVVDVLYPYEKYGYEYDESTYKNYNTPMIVKCPKHGLFEVTPNNLIRNNCSCKQCKKEYKAKEYIKKTLLKFYEVHSGKYEYETDKFFDSKTKIKIYCKTHNYYFYQTVSDHLAGKVGCKKCIHDMKYEAFAMTTKKFIEKANKIHNNFYSYEKVEYKLSRLKVEILCPIHGSFWQSPNSHLAGHGCPHCSNFISKYESMWLDSCDIPNDKQHRQILIEIDGEKYNVDGFDPETNTVYEFYGDYWHGNPEVFHSSDENKHSKIKFGVLYDNTKERENILRDAGYNLITIWEKDYHDSIKCSHNGNDDKSLPPA